MKLTHIALPDLARVVGGVAPCPTYKADNSELKRRKGMSAARLKLEDEKWDRTVKKLSADRLAEIRARAKTNADNDVCHSPEPGVYEKLKSF